MQAFAIVAAVSATSCLKEPAVELYGDMLRFSVSEAGGWNTQFRDDASAAEERSAAFRENAAEVFSLRGENPADTLFLHASIADGIVSPHRNVQTDRLQTRAAPVGTADFYDSFGLSASVYTGTWSEKTCMPDYIYDVEVTKASSWTTSYYWPGPGRKIRCFAYAPYGGDGIVLSDKTSAGSPSIAYTVPASVEDQLDLLVADTGEIAGDTSIEAAPLTFSHALTAVRFTTGDDMLSGHIEKITLKGVYSSGSLKIGTGSWSVSGPVTDFSQVLSVQADGSSDQEITPVDATFMMLPQTLPSGSSIEVIYTDNLTSTKRILTASIAGRRWPMGSTVTYRISTSSIIVTPTFILKTPGDFSYLGGSAQCSVTSYATVSRKGDETKTVPVAWTAEFVEDDGNGGYNVIDRPEWLTDFTESGDGDISSAMEFPVTVTPQKKVVSNAQNRALEAAPAVSGTYDLSTSGGTTAMQTANCYTIHAPGKYSLPLVYGNAIKDGAPNPSAYTSKASGYNVLTTFVNHLDAPVTDPYIYNNAGCTPHDAVLVWQDEPLLVTDVSLAPDGRNLTFEVKRETIKEGNAMVAVRDADKRIIWSWHIWVTDFVPGLAPTVEMSYDPAKTQRDKVVTNFQGKQYTFMGVNIGWCHAETTTYDARSVKVRFTQEDTGKMQVVTITQPSHSIVNSGNQPCFQHGRKDPMPAANYKTHDSLVDKGYYPENGYAFDNVDRVVNIGRTIQESYRAFGKNGNWCETSYRNLWSADNNKTEINGVAVVKTIYDPSPAGYHLPSPYAFTGFTYYDGNDIYTPFSSQINSFYTSSTDITDNFGFIFYCNRMKGAGKYDTEGGLIFFPMTGHRIYLNLFSPEECNYWPCLDGNMNFNEHNILIYNTNYGASIALAVRPVRE